MTALHSENQAHRGDNECQDPRQGCRLVLKFIKADPPQLDRIEYYPWADAAANYLQQGGGQNSFSFSRAYQALAVLVVETCVAFAKGQTTPYFLTGERRGSLAASLGDAIETKGHQLRDLFAEPGRYELVSRLKNIFVGKNVHGKDDGERRICINPDWLPLANIHIYWDARGDKSIKKPGEFRALADRLWTLTGETPKVTPLIEIPEDDPLPPREPTPVKPAEPPLATQPSQEDIAFSLPNIPELIQRQDLILWALKDHCTPEEITLMLKSKGVATTEARVRTFCQAIAAINPIPPKAKAEPNEFEEVDEGVKQAPEAKTQAPPDHATESTETPPDDSPLPATYQPPLVPLIPPHLFEFYTDGLVWDDEDPLMSFGEEVEPWRLKDAYEGLLILGAPGSGKTSGSGATFARQFLQAGFGGLILCAKPGEAQRWLKLCHEAGRGPHVRVVDRSGQCKLNFLAYESQRPGAEFGLAENLVKLFRVLVDATSLEENRRESETIWVNATNQLLRSLFAVFLLAQEPLTVDGLNRFLSKAPKAKLNNPAKDWRKIPIFGDILYRASLAQSPAEQRVFAHVLDYWTQEYPGYSDKTRSSFTLGFSAMADILCGRGIHELASSGTTLTPEFILNGGLVILDLPLKTCGQGGLLIQMAWKHLFQMAVERRTMADNDAYRYRMCEVTPDNQVVPVSVTPGMGDRRCPVFLWEDEGQFFFSKHDINFQATCRESRAAHVIISQNLHNFYQLGHGQHAVEGVFALMNTQVFHCNMDDFTNRWAAHKIGQELKMRFNFSITANDPPKSNQAFDPFSRSSKLTTSSAKNWELLVRPEEFSALLKGGNGTCEAIVLWMSHQFPNNDDKPYARLIFNQE